MTKEFDAAFNRCLDMLDRGASLEDCLEAFPQHSANLRPRLEAEYKARWSEDSPASERDTARHEHVPAETAHSRSGRQPLHSLSPRLVPVAAAATPVALVLIGLAIVGPLRVSLNSFTA